MRRREPAWPVGLWIVIGFPFVTTGYYALCAVVTLAREAWEAWR
jgi:hypothetical protein